MSTNYNIVGNFGFGFKLASHKKKKKLDHHLVSRLKTFNDFLLYIIKNTNSLPWPQGPAPLTLQPHFIATLLLRPRFPMLEPLLMLWPVSRQGPLVLSPSPHLHLMGSFSSFKSHLHEPFLDLPIECSPCALFALSSLSWSFCIYLLYLPSPMPPLFSVSSEKRTGDRSTRGEKARWPLPPSSSPDHFSSKS